MIRASITFELAIRLGEAKVVHFEAAADQDCEIKVKNRTAGGFKNSAKFLSIYK